MWEEDLLPFSAVHLEGGRSSIPVRAKINVPNHIALTEFSPQQSAELPGGITVGQVPPLNLRSWLQGQFLAILIPGSTWPEFFFP